MERERLDNTVTRWFQTRQTRRTLIARAALLGVGAPVLSALLAACGGEESGSTPAPTPTQAAGTAATPVAASPTPTQAVATPTVVRTPTSAPAVAEVVIGAIHPLSGGLAQDGAFVKNGIDLAVEEINAAGGIASLGGAKLRVEHADSQGKPEVGQAEAERLIGAGVVALLGAYQSAVTFNTTQVAEREGVPHVVTVAVANSILERGFKYTFRHQPDQTQMTRGLLEALVELRQKSGQPIATAVMVHEDSLFGTGFADLLKATAGEYDLEILETVPYSLQGLTDVTTELTRVQSLNPDIAIVTGYLNDGILIARTAHDIRLRPPLIGLSNGAFSTAQFVEQLGELTEGIMDANYHYDASNPRAREVRDRYKQTFGADMPTHAVMAYEAIRILADALERAGTTDRAAVRDALAATSFADHILPYAGPIEYDERGQAKNARSVLMQIQNGAILQVLPSDVAEAEPIFPPPRSWE